MYNQDKNIWESQSYRLSEQNWCRDPENQKDPKALYMRADMQLADLRDGSDNANAVYWMEQSAKGGHVPAMVAMGDLFLYGLAVKQSRKLAIFWYEKAAAQGDAYAQEKLEQLRKKRRNKTLVWSSAVTAAAAAVVIVLLCILGTGLEGVIVHENTDLIQTTTQEEFFSNLQTVLEQNDTQLMISGQVSTNRLMLKFEGEGIDLSQFPAATVIWGEDNYLVLQFASQEEAARCLDALRNMDNVSFVEEDTYRQFNTQGKPVFSAPATGGYMTWGAEFMGMDDLSAWVCTQKTDPVLVAVIDSGTAVAPEYAGRVLPGANFVEGGNGQYDNNGHGTHVGSIIMDCTRGLDVSVLPIRVLNGDGLGATSVIVEGIKYALNSDADVINMSLGGPCNPTPLGGSCGGGEDYYINQAVASGKIVVVAAGNSADNTKNYCPAHLESAIVVSACDNNAMYTDFTNFGDSVDVCAPGKDVVNYGPGLEMYAFDGTSQAAPHISALAAMLRSYLPNKTVEQLTKYIKAYCILPGDPTYYGSGIPYAAYFAGD